MCTFTEILSETANAMRPQVISNDGNHCSLHCLSIPQYNSKFLHVLEITQKRLENLLLPKKLKIFLSTSMTNCIGSIDDLL